MAGSRSIYTSLSEEGDFSMTLTEIDDEDMDEPDVALTTGEMELSVKEDGFEVKRFEKEEVKMVKRETVDY